LPYIVTRPRMATALAALGLLAAAAPASASTAANPDNCTPIPAAAHPFTPWGDFGTYALLPGGDFEAKSPSWLFQGASVVAGDDGLRLGFGSHGKVLSLPAGSSAVTQAVCVDETYPWIRFAVRNTGRVRASMKVESINVDAKTNIVTKSATTVTALPGMWAPSGMIRFSVKFAPGSAAPVSFRFTPDKAASWQIDDVFVDPRARG
jgi:hypothetical protein